MSRLIASPSVVQAAGNLPKRIEEFTGHVNTGDDRVSVARMRSPAGWEEPAAAACRMLDRRTLSPRR